MRHFVSIVTAWIAVSIILSSISILSQLLPVDIFEKYYKPYRMDNIDRSGSINTLSDIQYYYNKGNYNIAINKLNDCINYDIHFYKGICIIELALKDGKIDDLNNAIKSFEIARNPDCTLYYPATWYVALTCLKLGKKDMAKKYLIELKNIRPYAEDVHCILEYLE